MNNNIKVTGEWNYHFINEIFNRVFDKEDITPEHLKMRDSKRYLIGHNVLDQINKVKVTDKDGNWNVDLIKYLPPVCETIIFHKQVTIQYSFDGKKLILIQYTTSMNKDIYPREIDFDTVWLEYNVDSNQIRYNRNGSCEFNLKDRDMTATESWVSSLFHQFLQTVSFLHLTPITYKIIEGKSKTGDFLKNTQVKNETNKSITLVNIDWNYHTIRTTGFDVSGHYRWQRCGVGYSEIKMIFISPFRKNGYSRRAQKETTIV